MLGKRGEPSRDASLGLYWLRLGHLRFEKCDLKEAEKAFLDAWEHSRSLSDPRLGAEVLVGLLRFAGEALDLAATQKWESSLDHLIEEHPRNISPLVWYAKGALAIHSEKWLLGQRFFHKFLKTARIDPEVTDEDRCVYEARAILMLANAQAKRGARRRSFFLLNTALSRFEKINLKGINGVLYLLLGQHHEALQQFPEAMEWYKKAHGAFLGEHNWYHHLYVLLAYARLARLQQNYGRANFYLDLIDKAASSAEFGVMRTELLRERKRLDESAVDLLVDGQKGIVRTRETGPINLRKQYVLLDILRALTKAHRKDDASGQDTPRGLSKGEIIEQVWKENYRPEAHDNKLYYNINRLRKLIEPNFRQPKYLLNWKEGYRLAPGLKIQWLGLERMASSSAPKRTQTNEVLPKGLTLGIKANPVQETVAQNMRTGTPLQKSNPTRLEPSE